MGAILTKSKIIEAIERGDIVITDFDMDLCGPNSYDLHTGHDYITYDRNGVIDPMDPTSYKPQYHELPLSGLIVQPGHFVLISSLERIRTNKYIPMITGRSSIGRLGISVHQEAGFGDIGFSGNWTFQITTLYPTVIYPNMRIAQVYFLVPEGNVYDLYHGRYMGSAGATASKFAE